MILKKALAGLLALSLLLGLVGCGINQPVPTEADTLSPLEVGNRYELALSGLTGDPSLEIEEQRTIAVGKQVFSVEETQALRYFRDDAGKLQASISRKADYGLYHLNAEEIFLDGTLYAKLNDLLYSTEMTEDTFSVRYIPLKMVNASLYKKAAISPDDKTLTFSEPISAETWLGMNESAQLQSATATITLDEQGAVSSTLYEVVWTEGATTVTRKITVDLLSATDAAPEIPVNAKDYLPTADLDIIYDLEESYGLLLQAENITSASQDTIFCEAFGISRTAYKTVDIWGKEDAQMIRTLQNLTAITYATGERESEIVDEIYRDGKYIFSSNGGQWEENSEVTKETMVNHYQTLLLNYFWEYGAFTDVTATTENGITLYTFTCGEDFDASAKADICYQLFQQEDFLDLLSDSYRSGENTYYLAVDATSGLPTAVGMTYAGYHTVADTEYALTQQVNQSFDLASLSAYENITGEPEPTEEPTEKATPLFYKVTGRDGQVMWLLGTIHVGDARTTDLPEEITKALKEADALAVEVDVQEAQQQMEEDSELISALTAIYCYPDTTTADHVTDKELYAKAERLMKASGNFSTSAMLMKPSVWSNQLEEFYLRQGYDLTAELGVDAQLLAMAKAQKKQIFEIESVIDQAKLLYGWSESLQQLLLETTANTTPAQYNAATRELYELWCAGDAQGLKEALVIDIADAALATEYRQAMLTDRNARMLESAKTYLESGQTVFFAVGIAHLVTDNGLVRALTNAGYIVDQVSYQ